MAQVITTLTSDVTAPVDYVLMRGLLSAARKNLPFFAGTMPGELERTANGSASVKWRRIENLSAVTASLAEVAGNATFGNTRDAVKATITDVTTAIAKKGNALYLTEEIDLFNVNSRTAQLMDTLGKNAGESLNYNMRNAFSTGVSAINRFGGGVASKGVVVTAISLNDIKYTVNQINRNSGMKFLSIGYGSKNVGSSPIREAYYGICHPDVEEDVRLVTGFVGVEQYGGYTETEPGEFGSVGGVRWIVSEIALIIADGGVTSANGLRGTTAGVTSNDIYESFIYGKEAVGSVGLGENHAKEIYKMGDRVPTVELIYHKPGSSGVADMFNEVGSLAWKSWFGAKVLNDYWIGKISTGASDLS